MNVALLLSVCRLQKRWAISDHQVVIIPSRFDMKQCAGRNLLLERRCDGWIHLHNFLKFLFLIIARYFMLKSASTLVLCGQWTILGAWLFQTQVVWTKYFCNTNFETFVPFEIKLSLGSQHKSGVSATLCGSLEISI